MSFILDPQELKPGLILFRRGDEISQVTQFHRAASIVQAMSNGKSFSFYELFNQSFVPRQGSVRAAYNIRANARLRS